MELDHLRDAWTRQPDRASDRAEEEWIRRVAARDRAIRRRATIRDFVEFGAAACTAAWIVRNGVLAEVRWPWIGAAAITLSVGAVFLRERLRSSMAARAGADVAENLQRALQEADRQVVLVRSVLWWYLIPLGLAAVLVVAGAVLNARATMDPALWATHSDRIVLAFVALMLVLVGSYGAVWWANRRVLRTRLLPHRTEIAELIRQLASHEEGGSR